MPDFVSYTPITRSRTQTPVYRGFTTSGPLDTYLQALTSSQTTETSTEAPTSSGFRWNSGGRLELPYSVPTILAVQPTQQPIYQLGSSRAQQAVQTALSQLGRPYVYGAKGQNGAYDCSGLIYAAYKSAGVDVPGSTAGWLSSGKLTVGRFDGLPGDVIITGSKNSPSGRHARMITRNLGNGTYEWVEAKGKLYGVVTSTYTVDNDLKNIYRAKLGIKLIKKGQK